MDWSNIQNLFANSTYSQNQYLITLLCAIKGFPLIIFIYILNKQDTSLWLKVILFAILRKFQKKADVFEVLVHLWLEA